MNVFWLVDTLNCYRETSTENTFSKGIVLIQIQVWSVTHKYFDMLKTC